MRLREDKRALVIVAHPDDETIWMGGTIMKYKSINWTIFSLCRASDLDRAPKFRRVCDYYGAESIIADLDDEGRLSGAEGAKAAEKLLAGELASRSRENGKTVPDRHRGRDCDEAVNRALGKKFDYIFTHGLNGEYGHPVHIQVHTAVNKLLNKKILKPEAVFYFNYKKEAGQKYKLIAGKNSDLIIKLTAKEFAEKQKIVAEMYGYPMDGIDVAYCVNPEGFKILRL